MATDNLTSEVSALTKPEKFKPVSIDIILQRFIPINLGKSDVEKILLQEGFKILPEVKLQSDSAGLQQTKLSAVYEYKRLIAIFPPNYKVVIDIVFEHDKVVNASGWYVAHLY